MTALGKTPTFATIAVIVAALVSPESSPPVPLSAMRRGGTAVSIPLPEHPRPDFERDQWQNLNGPWQFQLDAPDSGEARGWFRGELPAPRQIIVPFPWGSPLSGVPDSAVIAWYSDRKSVV